MNRLEEVQFKHNQIRNFLDEHHFDGMLLGTNANFSWLTAGGDDHLEIIEKTGSAMIFATRQRLTLVAGNNEMRRLKNEALGEIESLFDFEMPAWYDPRGSADAVSKLAGGMKTCADIPWDGTSFEKNSIAELRYIMTENEISRYRWLGQHSASVVEAVAREIEPGMSEHEIEALMAGKLLAEQIFPVVLLIATDDRIFKYRHPIPSDKKLEKFAHLILCARRWGLVITFTRCVHFGKIPSELTGKQEAAAFVDATFISQTRPGAVAGRILNNAKAAYALKGYPDEWQNHHQGGLTGYEPREYVAFSDSTQTVQKNQVFGWNPTIQGTKSEDTILVTDSTPEILTQTNQWPYIDVEIQGQSYKRPAILER